MIIDHNTISYIINILTTRVTHKIKNNVRSVGKFKSY